MVIEFVCQECGHLMKFTSETGASQFNKFSYPEIKNATEIQQAIQKIVSDFESQPFECFEFN